MRAHLVFAVAATIAAFVTHADLASGQILQGKKVLFVGSGDPDPTGGDDAFVFDHLEDLGADVTYFSGDASTTADGEEADLIIISSTLGSGSVRGKFHELETPILNWEEALMDGNTTGGNFSMGAGSENGTGDPGFEIPVCDHGGDRRRRADGWHVCGRSAGEFSDSGYWVWQSDGRRYRPV